MSIFDGAVDHPAYIASMLFVCAVAVILNVLVIIIIAKVGKFRTSVEVFLTNLAASDIWHAGIVLPIHFKNLSVREQDFYGGSFVCKLVMFIPLFTVMSAISTMIAIAADRYRVMIYRRTLYRWETVIIVCIIWLISFCISSPQLYEYNIYQKTKGTTNQTQISCGSEGIVEGFETIYASVVFLLAYCLPLIILTVCYIRISFLVWKHARRFQLNQTRLQDSTSARNNGGGQLEKMVSARQVKVLKMLISITVAFVLLWTPFFILFAIQEITDMDHTTDLGKWPHVVSRTMTVLSTFTNPTLYLIFSDAFRQSLFNVFKCTFKQPHGLHTDSDSATYREPFFSCCARHWRRSRRVEPAGTDNGVRVVSAQKSTGICELQFVS